MGVTRRRGLLRSVAAMLGLSWLGACPIVESLVHGGREVGPEAESVIVDARAIERELVVHGNCLESLTGPIDDSFARYVEIAGDGEDPRRRRRLFIYSVTHGAFRICESAVAEIRSSLADVEDLEAQLAAFVTRAEAYADVSQRFADVLRDDAETSTVADLHRELLIAYEAWREQADGYARTLENERSRNDEPYLDLLAQDGDKLEWHARAAVAGARGFVHCLGLAETVSTDCAAPAMTFLERAEAFAAYHRDHADEGAHVFWLRTFATDLDELRAVVSRWVQGTSDDRRRAVPVVVEAHQVLVRDAATLDFGFAPRSGQPDG